MVSCLVRERIGTGSFLLSLGAHNRLMQRPKSKALKRETHLNIDFYLLVEKYQFEIETGSKHKNTGVHLDLGDRGRWQRIRDADEADVREAGLEGPGQIAAHRLLLDFQVTSAMDNLQNKKRPLAETAAAFFYT